MENIVIKGAREHNLKDINLTIPRNKLVVITGVSGSGKSTLAFDTLYAEGQRRYVESLSSYARQFLGVMNKPDVDSIDGLSPAISIEQKSVSRNPRSTVGTTTEIYDYLRLLYARVGKSHCSKCSKPVSPQTHNMITDSIMNLKGEEVVIISPVIRQKKGTHQKLLQDLSKDGFSLVLVNGEQRYSDDLIELDKNKKHDITAIIDQFVIDDRHHVSDVIQTALNLSKGYVIVKVLKKKEEKFYTSHFSCLDCGISIEDFSPRSFSFNSPFGACRTCSGLGVKYTFDEDLIIPNKDLSIADGAIKAFRTAIEGYRIKQIGRLGKMVGFSIFEPFKILTKKLRNLVLYGSTEKNPYTYEVKRGRHSVEYEVDHEGVIPLLQRLHETTESEFRRKDLERYMRSNKCSECNGRRLKPEILSVFVKDLNIAQITELSVTDAVKFFNKLNLNKTDTIIADQILREIRSRFAFLESVGLGYLSLDRRMETLSGGEAQRIRLATQIGSNLMGVMYVLDEPSIGLHQRDNARLIKTLKRLRDLGNTVIVVEHDEDTIKQADYVVDIGPGAGVHGGAIVASGTPEDICNNKKSLTGKYLSKELLIQRIERRRKLKGRIEIFGASENNLKNLDVAIPTGVFVCVTGVSGSGKSSLVNEVLAKGISKELYKSKDLPGKHKEIRHDIDSLILIDQSPIGRTPRSNPATYTKMFDYIRKLFALTKDAKIRGYKQGQFSFNVKGGRCENCQGDGTIKIEMNFLPDVYVKCDECKSMRYNSETLEILYKGKNIAQILSMNVEEALLFFEAIPPVRRKLQTLYEVGLGYIEIGQSAVTFSGGEAQRIKLSRELSKISKQKTLYILDEPTTGLHFDDVNKLLVVLNRLVDKGATVLVIEHNLDVIKNADHIIDLGPEGGKGGGMIIAQGTPEKVASVTKSYTGKFLKKILK
jgi:excinuclease ABC subunit A